MSSERTCSSPRLRRLIGSSVAPFLIKEFVCPQGRGTGIKDFRRTCCCEFAAFHIESSEDVSYFSEGIPVLDAMEKPAVAHGELCDVELVPDE